MGEVSSPKDQTMSWQADLDEEHTTANRPLLYPDLDYPRQPNHPLTTSTNSLSIEIVSPHGGRREIDLESWDKEALTRLRSNQRPTGDLCDSISFLRGPFGLRDPCVSSISRNHVLTNRRPFGVIWFVRDPCGIVCLIFTWFLIVYAEYVISSIILARAPSTTVAWFAGAIYHFFAIMAVVSHFKAFSTDPGTVPIGNATRSAVSYIIEVYGDKYQAIVRCPKCVCVKPSRSHHCRVCVRCVRKMDHHCPWINNCVGEGNQKYFVLFTLYICLQSFVALCMSVQFIIQCIGSDWESCQLNPDRGWLANLLLVDFTPLAMCAFLMALIMESFVFGLFTLIMCISQVHSIVYDETCIESLGKSASKAAVRSKCKNLAIACGSPISWRWFNPFSPPPPVTPVFPGLGGLGQDFIPPDLPLSASNSVSISLDSNGTFDSVGRHVSDEVSQGVHSRSEQVLAL